jgi:hypothetical protein
MTTHKNFRSRLGGAESCLNGQILVKKWCVVDPKLIFAKNQDLLLLALKSKPTPVPAKSAGDCAQSKNYLRRLPQWNKSWYAYPRWSIIYVGCFSQLSISRFGSRFTEKPDFRTPKMEKALFVGRNKNRPPWHSMPSQGPRTCPIWPHFDKLCHDQGRS